MKQLLLKCTMNVQFMFNGQLFRQIDGVANGSLSEPLLADLFISKLKREVLNDMILRLRVYARYMDDIWIKISNEGMIWRFHRLHILIMFSCELEKQDATLFLDALLSREKAEQLNAAFIGSRHWVDNIHTSIILHLCIKKEIWSNV